MNARRLGWELAALGVVLVACVGGTSSSPMPTTVTPTKTDAVPTSTPIATPTLTGPDVTATVSVFRAAGTATASANQVIASATAAVYAPTWAAIAAIPIPPFAGTIDRVPLDRCAALFGMEPGGPMVSVPWRPGASLIVGGTYALYDCWLGSLHGQDLQLAFYADRGPGLLVLRYGEEITGLPGPTPRKLLPGELAARFTGDYVCLQTSRPFLNAVNLRTGEVLGARGSSLTDPYMRICAPPAPFPPSQPGWGPYVLGLGAKQYPLRP